MSKLMLALERGRDSRKRKKCSPASFSFDMIRLVDHAIETGFVSSCLLSRYVSTSRVRRPAPTAAAAARAKLRLDKTSPLVLLKTFSVDFNTQIFSNFRSEVF